MKKYTPALIKFLISFILSTLIIVSYLFYDFSNEINMRSIMNVLFRFGLRFAFAIAILYILLDFLLKKMKQKKVLSIIIIAFSVYALYYYYHFFLWYVGISGLIDNPFVK
jgi:surface polysaccharide O-acyltransferase-like enzyme